MDCPSVCCDWREGAGHLTSEDGLCNVWSQVQWENLLWATLELQLRTAASLLELPQAAVPLGGTAPFQWPRFAGMHKFCKRNRAALGRNWLCKKTHLMELHSVSMRYGLQLWNNATGACCKTTWVVLTPHARAAAHQFHESFPQVSCVCHWWQYHVVALIEVMLSPVTDQVRKVRRAWWAVVGAEACSEHGGSLCSGRTSVTLFVSPLSLWQIQSDTFI